MASKRKRKGKSAAILTVHGAGKMTPKGRRAIAGWLRKHAAMLVKYGNNYSRRFTGRYLYR
ncbi:MAG: hypothetical protein Q7R45_07270 [Sulfuricaulis sp.]|nr:hypothetical protein [Sulfuricaulis sp.]